MITSTISTNRFAVVSASLAALTLVSFCIGFIPIPMTAWVCYPAAILLSIAAIVTGIISLRQLRGSGENGRTLAWVGIWIGALAILAVLCFTTLTVGFVVFGVDVINSLIQQIQP